MSEASSTYVSVAQAARELDVSEARIRQLIKDSKLKIERWDGRTNAIQRASLDAYKAAYNPRKRRGPARGHGGKPRKERA